MNTGINAMFIAIMLTIVMYVTLDMQKTDKLLNDLVEYPSVASQNSLMNLMPKIEGFENTSKEKILEEWLVSFIENNNVPAREIQLDFAIINEEPQVVLVKVKGYDDYILLGGELTTENTIGTLIEER